MDNVGLTAPPVAPAGSWAPERSTDTEAGQDWARRGEWRSEGCGGAQTRPARESG